MANLVEHTMLNGLEENLKSAIEMAGGEIPADSCVWDYPGIIRDQLSSGGQILKVLPGKGISVERDSKGNYVVSVIEADSTENIKMDTIQAPSYAVGVKNGYWPKGTILQNFLEDLFSKVLPYVPSVLSGEIIIADNEGNDVFGYDEQTKDPQVKNGLDKNNQYLRLNIASQTEPVYISLENLRVKAEDVNVDLSNYYVKSEVDNLIKTSQDELSSNVDEVINNITDRINAHYIKLENLRKDVNSLNEKILTDYYTKDDIDNRLSNLSGNVDLSNYYTKDQINTTVDKVNDDVDKIDDEVNDLKLKVATDYYTKAEIKEQISNVKVDLSGYYTKSETDSAINNVKDTVDDVKDYANNLNVKLTTDYYTKSDVYNKPEINSLIDNKISEIPEVDLSGYYTKSETDSAINDIIENFQIQTSPESEPVKIVETVVEVTEKVSQQTEQITQVEQTIQKQESQISHVTEQINNIDQTIIETVQNIDAVDHSHSESVFVEIFGKSDTKE
jgi:prefoldin subunit 5